MTPSRYSQTIDLITLAKRVNDDLSKLRFDDSLEAFAIAVVDVLGLDAFEDGRALRDPFGRLSYISSKKLEPSIRVRLLERLAAALAQYFSTDIGVIEAGEFGFAELWAAPVHWELVWLNTEEVIYIDVVDRRIVGQDWLASPDYKSEPTPPRLVFWSVKGGVGRSTALSVLAVHLAQASAASASRRVTVAYPCPVNFVVASSTLAMDWMSYV